MLVSTCSNLNIIQIEKNHTKTPRGMITKEIFFLSGGGGDSFEILTTELTVRALKTN